jgi:hypothetical protein
MNDHDTGMLPLSEAGEQRRTAIREELLAAMRRHHAARRARRHAIALGGLAAALALASVLAMPRQAPPRSPMNPPTVHAPAQRVASPRHPEEADAPVRTPAVAIMYVQTDPSILERYAAGARPLLARAITDDELLDTLVEIGRPTGLVRMEGRVWLTATVTDDVKGAAGPQRPPI